MRSPFTHHGFDPIPALVRLEPLLPNLWVVPFPLMKVLPAEYILRRGLNEGLINKSTVIVESSSGNFAMGLTLECHRLGLKLYLVGDPAITPDWRRRMRELKGLVILVTVPDSQGSYQKLRLDLVERIRAKHPNHFYPSQYHNENNPLAYADLAESIVDSIGQVDALVGPVGSGGSLSGTSMFLRSIYPHLHVIAVDTPNSVLFGQKDGPRALRGLGNSVLPKNLKHELVDEVHWQSAGVAYRATRELYSQHRLFQGGTSGASYQAARWYAAKNPNSKVVAILPDDGNRYMNTIYNRNWLLANGYWLDRLPEEPTTVSSPQLALGPWNRFEWNRRQLQDVMATGASVEAA